MGVGETPEQVEAELGRALLLARPYIPERVGATRRSGPFRMRRLSAAPTPTGTGAGGLRDGQKVLAT